eukprot:705507-Lingulodinium_polyedra.AAC.1
MAAMVLATSRARRMHRASRATLLAPPMQANCSWRACLASRSAGALPTVAQTSHLSRAWERSE